MCVIISIWCFLKNKKTTYSPKRKQMSKLILEVPKCSHAKISPLPSNFEGGGDMLYFVLSFGHARVGRHSRPLPCGRHAHAVLAKHKCHTLCQVGREDGVHVVIERRVGHVGEQGRTSCDFGGSPAASAAGVKTVSLYLNLHPQSRFHSPIELTSSLPFYTACPRCYKHSLV